MTVRSFVFDGIRQILVDHRGRGSLVVQPGPRADTVEGSLGCADHDLLHRVEVDQRRDLLKVTVPPGPGGSDVHLRLGVPPGLAYVVSGGAVDVTLESVADRAWLRVGSGEVELDQVADLRCRGGSGEVRVGRITGGVEAAVGTESGNIRVAAAEGPLTLSSGSGDVHVMRAVGGPLWASTGSGDITVAATSGSVDLRTTSGELTVGVADDLPASLDLQSATGGVRIALGAGAQPEPAAPHVAIRARTESGEIAVYRA